MNSQTPTTLARDLAAALGDASLVQSDPDIVASLSRDQAPLAPAGVASVLVRARSIDHVSKTLSFADARKIPVVTRGAGTGLAGGANAIDGCILLSVAAMNAIVKIDETTRIAVVQPGVLNGALASEVAARGLYYAPDPASRDISTIGGNIATNAGGSCCLKYGVTGDHVAALKVVLADGSVIHTGTITTKNVAGFDLTKLITGSEGTLGVIVEATVRLLRAPRPPSTLAAFFETIAGAGAACVAMDAAADLSLVEIMDRTTVTAVENMTHMDLDTTAAAMVLVQSDASDAHAMIETCEKICNENGARTVMRSDDPEEGKMLLLARRKALPALEKLGTTLLDDIAVPKPSIPVMIEKIAKIAERNAITIGTFGHAGDGNLHPTIVFEQGDEASRKRAFEAFDQIVRVAIDLGGTITGEHGVGSLKQRYLKSMIGKAEQDLMQRIKSAFDPNGILNPGKAI